MALVGCAASANKGADFADTGATMAMPTASSTGISDTSPSTELVVPIWYHVDGTLVLSSGSVEAYGSSFTVEYLDVEESVTCVASYDIELVVDAEVPDPSIDIYGWWSLDLVEVNGCDDGYHTPFQTLTLGFGAWDQLLAPAAAAAGVDESRVYGLYLQPGLDDTVWVFGVASTPAHSDGTIEPTETISDGVYELKGLHLLPLAG